MGSYEIRTLTPADAHANRTLMSHAFSRGRVVTQDPDKAEDADYGKDTRGLFEGGKLAASLTIRPFAVHWGAESTVPMGGIAGVASFAEARGQGFVDALMKDSLHQMRARGEVVSSLYPFAFAFYRRYGWDWVGEERTVTLPLRELRSAPEGRSVRAIPAEEGRGALEPAYTEFARRYRGLFTAETHQWNRSLDPSDGRAAHVYGFGGDDDRSPESYLTWRFDGSGKGGEVREFVVNSPAGFRGLLSLLYYLGTQCDKARLTMPSDLPLWAHLMHWDLETRLGPVFMARVVDVAAAFERLGGADGTVSDGECLLRVRDEHAPWNDGLFRVAAEGGNVSCSPVVGGGAEPDVSMDITALSQAFWGTPSLDWLRGAGRLDVRSEPGYRALAAVLPAANVFTLDAF